MNCPCCSSEIKEEADLFHCAKCNLSGDTQTQEFWKSVTENIPPVFLGHALEIASSYGLLSKYTDSCNKAIEDSAGMDYLKQRGIDADTINKFSIGYAAKLSIDLNERQDFISLGVLNDAGAQFFYKRIVFPIYDVLGRICGFGGRAISNDVKPKYLNSPDTKIYDKGSMLYGLYHCYKNVLESGPLLLVEGYFDVIRCQIHGFNAVAPMGTGLTWRHAALISRYTKEVTIVADSDIAGQKSAHRSSQVLKEWGVKSRIGKIPILKDPDEFILEYGPEAFENECIDRAQIAE